MSMQNVLNISSEINNGRTLSDVMLSLQEEVGELATEIAIHTGHSYKSPSSDGVVGEAVDAMVVLIDIIKLYNPDITVADIETIMQTKSNKWKRKVDEHDAFIKSSLETNGMDIKVFIEVVNNNKIISRCNETVSDLSSSKLLQAFDIDEDVVAPFLRDGLIYIETHGDALVTITNR